MPGNPSPLVLSEARRRQTAGDRDGDLRLPDDTRRRLHQEASGTTLFPGQPSENTSVVAVLGNRTGRVVVGTRRI